MRRPLLRMGWALASLAGIFAVAACANILGIGDRQLEDSGAGASGGNVVLAQLNHPYAIVADPQGQNLYFTEYGTSQGTSDGAVSKCSAAGCGGSPTRLATGLDNPTMMAIDSEYVYWINATANQIVKCGLSGCSNTPTILPSTSAPGSIAVDDTYMYWLDYSQGVLYRASKIDGSGRKTLAGPTDGFVAPNLCYVAESELLVSDEGIDGGMSSVWKLGTNGGGITQLTTNAGCPCWFASDSSHYFWATEGRFLASGTVVSVPASASNTVDGGPTILTAQNSPQALVLDPTNSEIYVANYGSGQATDGTLVKIPSTGGNPTTLLSNLAPPVGLALAGGNAYVITYGSIEKNNILPNTGALISVSK